MMFRAVVVSTFALMLLDRPLCCAQSTQPSDDAWPLYSKAALRVEKGFQAGITSPAASNSLFTGYPPYVPEWHEMEKRAFEFNAPARVLVRQARSYQKAVWPSSAIEGTPDLRHLNQCRALGTEVADAAIYHHLQGNDAEAIESQRDLLHLADLLDASEHRLVEPIVGLGLRMLSMHRLEVITANLSLTLDAADERRAQIHVIKELIRQLWDARDPSVKFAAVLKHAAATHELTDRDRFLFMMRRGQMEQRLAAMSLACHVFRFEKSRWPASLAELLTYLPSEPTDAWGQMGYVLAKAQGSPGPDRPLVYSRYHSKDGLFYRIDEPQYEFYFGDGSDLPAKQRKEGGQFRDVTRWVPTRTNRSPTTRALHDG
jgi:hypothetical protein